MILVAYRFFNLPYSRYKIIKRMHYFLVYFCFYKTVSKNKILLGNHQKLSTWIIKEGGENLCICIHTHLSTQYVLTKRVCQPWWFFLHQMKWWGLYVGCSALGWRLIGDHARSCVLLSRRLLIQEGIKGLLKTT